MRKTLAELEHAETLATLTMQPGNDGTWYPADNDGVYTQSSWTADDLASLRGLLGSPPGFGKNYKLVELREIAPGMLLPVFKAPGRTAGTGMERYKKRWLTREEYEWLMKLRAK